MFVHSVSNKLTTATFVTFILIVHSWRMWQMLYHCLQLKNTCQSTLPGRHPHVQIWRLWQNVPHCTQVESTWEETSAWPQSIQMWDRGVRQSVFCSWNFDISHSDSQWWKTSCMSCWWMREAIYQSIQAKVTYKISHWGETFSLWNWGVYKIGQNFFAQFLLMQLDINVYYTVKKQGFTWLQGGWHVYFLNVILLLPPLV